MTSGTEYHEVSDEGTEVYEVLSEIRVFEYLLIRDVEERERMPIKIGSRLCGYQVGTTWGTQEFYEVHLREIKFHRKGSLRRKTNSVSQRETARIDTDRDREKFKSFT